SSATANTSRISGSFSYPETSSPVTGSIPRIAGLWPGSITMRGRLAGGTAVRVGRGDVCAWVVLRITLGRAWPAAWAGGMVDDAERAGESPGVLDRTAGVGGAGVRAALHPVTNAAAHIRLAAMVA